MKLKRWKAMVGGVATLYRCVCGNTVKAHAGGRVTCLPCGQRGVAQEMRPVRRMR